MLTVRRSDDRGLADHGWLVSRHTFSFADYYDPAHMGFGTLRVINDDQVAPGRGFGAHPHRDMEIVSYVVEGALEHRDSMGNGSIIRSGEAQRMTAGTGVVHSEYNHSKSDAVRFLQIWILPERARLEPSYEQKFFGDERHNALRLVASPGGRDGSVEVHQDLELFASVLDEKAEVHHTLARERMAWVQVIAGELSVNGTPLSQGDGAAIVEEPEVHVVAQTNAHFLLFDQKAVQ